MTIATYTTKALQSATAYGEAINHLRKLCAKLDADTARAEILPTVAAFYKVPLVDGKGKATGTLVLEREAKGFETAKRAMSRLMASIYETPKADKAPAKSMRVSKDVRALAEAYLANFDNVADAIKTLRAVAK